MRDFRDESGQNWIASAVEREDLDYKGRCHLVLQTPDGEGSEPLSLIDVQWNSMDSADRTLATMSEVELRKRLRSALGRGSGPG